MVTAVIAFVTFITIIQTTEIQL